MNNLTSKILPGAFELAAVPILGYGIFKLWTENAGS